MDVDTDAGSSGVGKLGRNAGKGGGATHMGQQTTGLTTGGLKVPGMCRLSVRQRVYKWVITLISGVSMISRGGGHQFTM